MLALVIREWDNAKDDRLKKYYETLDDFTKVIQDKAEKYHMVPKTWTQGVGHQVSIIEYDSLESLAKAWSDEEYKAAWTRYSRLVDNMTCRVLRSSMRVPPK